MTGSHEVRGSIPLGSTNYLRHTKASIMGAISIYWLRITGSMIPPTQNQDLPLADQEVLIFSHCPKTAGTTLRQLIGRQYSEDEVYTVTDEPGSVEAFKKLA